MGQQSNWFGRTYAIVSHHSFPVAFHQHCFRSESRCYHPNFLSTNSLSYINRYAWSPFEHLHFDCGVFLWIDSFSTLSIMVHTWLTIFGRVDGVSLSKLDFPLLMKFVHLPTDKCIIVWVGISCRACMSAFILLICGDSNLSILVRNCLLQSTLAPIPFKSSFAIGGKK